MCTNKSREWIFPSCKWIPATAHQRLNVGVIGKRSLLDGLLTVWGGFFWIIEEKHLLKSDLHKCYFDQQNTFSFLSISKETYQVLYRKWMHWLDKMSKVKHKLATVNECIHHCNLKKRFIWTFFSQQKSIYLCLISRLYMILHYITMMWMIRTDSNLFTSSCSKRWFGNLDYVFPSN